MMFKAGVTGLEKLVPKARAGLDLLDARYGEIHPGGTLVVTSIDDGKHMKGSLHGLGRAFDIRVHSIPQPWETARIRIGHILGPEWDIVLEPDHIHCEYDPAPAAVLAKTALPEDRTLSAWAVIAQASAMENGWDMAIPFEQALLNLHSEITEAWERIREGRGLTETWLEGPGNKPEGIPYELADLVLRVLHIASALGLDLPKLLEAKLAYNATRSFKHGGKIA